MVKLQCYDNEPNNCRSQFVMSLFYHLLDHCNLAFDIKQALYSLQLLDAEISLVFF